MAVSPTIEANDIARTQRQSRGEVADRFLASALMLMNVCTGDKGAYHRWRQLNGFIEVNKSIIATPGSRIALTAAPIYIALRAAGIDQSRAVRNAGVILIL